MSTLGPVLRLEPVQHRVLLMSLEQLVASPEPAVVFSSLAELCVPTFSDGCTMQIFQAEGAAYRVSYPGGSGDGSPTRESHLGVRTLPTAAFSGPLEVRTQIEVPAAADYPAYSGMLIHTWTGRAPTADCAAVARLLVDLAVASVQQERLAGLLQQAQNAVANLLNAVASNRQIGAAVGILMANHRLTEEQAFERLRMASQHTHRKLRDIAAEVTETGKLDLPPTSARPGHGFARATHR